MYVASDEFSEFVTIQDRVIHNRPGEEKGYWEDILGEIDEFKPSKCSYTIPDPEAWVMRYDDSRRGRLRLAAKLNDMYGLQRKHFYRGLFIKVEARMPTTDGLNVTAGFDLVKSARAIQSVSDRANAALGPFIHAVSKKISKLWSLKKYLCYCTGYTSEDVGRWWSSAVAHFGGEANCFALESDFSRMDCTVCFEALCSELDVYERFGVKDYPQAYTTLLNQLSTQGFSRFGHVYGIFGTRKSGDPNTSVGNSILTGLSTARMLKTLGVPKHGYRAIFLGDDVLVIISKKYRDRISVDAVSAEYLRAGFVSEPKIHEHPRDGSFCSQRFWPVAEGTILGPKIGRFLYKAGWTTSHEHSPQTHMRGVALGIANWTSGIPVVREYVDAILRLTSKVEATPIRPWMKEAVRPHHASADTWSWLHRWYPGINVDAIVGELKAMSRIPCLLKSDIAQLVHQDA